MTSATARGCRGQGWASVAAVHATAAPVVAAVLLCPATLSPDGASSTSRVKLEPRPARLQAGTGSNTGLRGGREGGEEEGWDALAISSRKRGGGVEID